MILRPWMATLAVLGNASLAAWGQAPPTVKTVEPDYSSLKGQTAEVPIQLDLIVTPGGTPLVFESFDGPLELHVVKALQQYQFGKAKNFMTYRSTLVIRRKVGDLASADHFLLPPSPAAAEVATGLDAAGAAKLEKNLPKKNSTGQRAVLLTYAATHADDAARQLRVRQLEWLVQNEPKADVLRQSVAIIPRREDPTGYDTVKKLWLDAVAKAPADPQVLEGAFTFLRMSEPQEAKSFLAPRAGRSLNAMRIYGELYGHSVMGVTAMDPLSGEATAAGKRLPTEGFSAEAQGQLLVEVQLPFLITAFGAMNGIARSLAGFAAMPDDYPQYCERVRARIVGLFPEFQPKCASPTPDRKLVSSDVMKGKLKKQVRPVYPELAKKDGIQGTVLLWAVIGTSGKITELKVIKGPFALIDESLRAVSGWEYVPYEVNGQPVPVLTEIEVNYQLR